MLTFSLCKIKITIKKLIAINKHLAISTAVFTLFFITNATQASDHQSIISINSPSAATAPLKKLQLTIAINTVTYNKYPQFLHKDMCKTTLNLEKDQIDRALLEVFLLCMAFDKQNIELILTFMPVSNYLRSIRMVQEGKAHTTSGSIWSSDIDEKHLYASIPTIRKGEFEKGIYAQENHPMLRLPLYKFDAANYVGITFKSWIHDWFVIGELTNKKKQIGHLPALFKMLKTGRGDFTLMEFPSTESLTITQGGIKLQPVNGIKVQLHDSRRIIISKRATGADDIFFQLNSGLKKLRSQGKIIALYKESGFINPLTKTWKTYNTPVQ